MIQTAAISQLACDASAFVGLCSYSAYASQGFALRPAPDLYLPPAGDFASSQFASQWNGLRFSSHPYGVFRLWLLSISNDDPTRPPDGGNPPGGAAPPGSNGGSANSAIFGVSALSAFYALASIRDRYGVMLDEDGLAEALADYGLIDWITNENRAAMKSMLSELKEKDASLRTLEDRIPSVDAERRSLQRYVRSRLVGVCALVMRGEREKLEMEKSRLASIESELVELEKQREFLKSFKDKFKRMPILEEWLGRMARSDYHDAYACITDKGLSILERMEAEKDSLEGMTFVDFMMSLNR